MHRDANRSGLICDRSRDRLANPPRCVRRELEALDVLELLHGADEADVPLLDQVQEAHAATDVLLGDRDDEAQVRLGQLLASAPAELHHVTFTSAELAERWILWIPTRLADPIFPILGDVLPLDNPRLQCWPGDLVAGPEEELLEHAVVAALHVAGSHRLEGEVDHLGRLRCKVASVWIVERFYEALRNHQILLGSLARHFARGLIKSGDLALVHVMPLDPRANCFGIGGVRLSGEHRVKAVPLLLLARLEFRLVMGPLVQVVDGLPRLVGHLLAELNHLGEDNLLFSGEQPNTTNLLEVHAHRIVDTR